MVPRPDTWRAARGTPAPAAGFTLIEILVVVGLMALLASLFLPASGLRTGHQLESSASVVRATLRAVQQRAITSGQVQRFVVDLDHQRYRVEFAQREPRAQRVTLPTQARLLDLAPPHESSDFRPIPDRGGDWQSLDDPTTWFREIQLGDHVVDQGTAAIAFSPDGGADPASVRLENDAGDRIELEVLPFTGEVRTGELEDG